MRLYWRLRWAVWDAREAWFVRAVERQMTNCDSLYVHPNGEAPAEYEIVRLEPKFDGAHGHVEGR